jgi:putative MATE family efflux protein
MAKDSTKDMTVGSPMKLILGFALPLLMGMLFQQVYSLVDTIIVGQFLGVSALAAVGATGSINFLIIGFCLGICSGFGLPVAQRFGAKDYKSLRKYVGNAAVLAVIITVVMTTATVLLCRNILQWMNTPSDIIDLSYRYIVVIFAGIPATILYNLLSSYLRSLGDSVTPVIFLVLSSVLNIGMDLWFIVTFRMGVFGASLATVLAQAISGILCLFYIRKKFEILHLEKDDWKLDGQYVRTLLVMGLPMGFQYSITAIGSVILQTAVNSLGSVAVASMTAASKISMFMCCPFDALGSTMATYGGQNVGAGKLNRLSKGLLSSGIIGSIYSVGILVVVYFFGENLVHLFVDASETLVVTQARQYLLINAIFYIPLVFVNVVRFLIQGMGHSGLAVFAGVFEMVARALVGMLFVPIYGFSAACFASPLAWIFADCFLFPAFFYVLHKMKRQMKVV